MSSVISPNFSRVWDDVSLNWSLLMKEKPSILSLFQIGADTDAGGKFEWFEESVEPTSFVAADVRAIGGATVEVTSADGAMAGMVLGVRTAANVAKTVQLLVTAVDTAADELTVSVYGGSTDAAIAATDILYLVSMPRKELSDNTDLISFNYPSTKTNYSQQFRVDYEISARAANTAVEWLESERRTRAVQAATNGAMTAPMAAPSVEAYHDRQAMIQLFYRLSKTALYGRKVAPTSGNAGKSSTDGLITMVEANSPEKTSTGAITADKLNAAFLLGDQAGADPEALNFILVSPANADKISRFNDGTVQTMQSENEYRRLVTTFTSTLGYTAEVIIDRQLTDDKIIIGTRDKMYIRPYRWVDGQMWTNTAAEAGVPGASDVQGLLYRKMDDGNAKTGITVSYVADLGFQVNNTANDFVLLSGVTV